MPNLDHKRTHALRSRSTETRLASSAAISRAHEVVANSRKIVARSIDMYVLSKERVYLQLKPGPR